MGFSTDIRTDQLMCAESLAKSMSTGRDFVAVSEYCYARQEREASRNHLQHRRRQPG